MLLSEGLGGSLAFVTQLLGSIVVQSGAKVGDPGVEGGGPPRPTRARMAFLKEVKAKTWLGVPEVTGVQQAMEFPPVSLVLARRHQDATKVARATSLASALPRPGPKNMA